MTIVPVFLRRRPPIPLPEDFPSGLHSPRVAARVGLWLAVAFTVCFVTGLISHFHQHPVGWFPLPTRPVWFYRVSQGLHVASGIAAIPLLVIKLWVVTPRFWKRPLFSGLVNALERISILVLIAAVAFELISGLLNVAEYYPWSFFFPPVHYAVAYIAVGALIVHIAVKLPITQEALSRKVSVADAPRPDESGATHPANETDAGAGTADRTVDAGRTVAADELVDADRTVAADQTTEVGEAGAGGASPLVERRHEDRVEPRVEHRVDEDTESAPPGGPPAPTSLSRRGLLVVAAGAVGAVTLATIGDRISLFSPVSVLAQRSGAGPNDLPVNRSAAAARVTESARDAGWRLSVVSAAGTRDFSLAELQGLPQYTAEIPIACVEGWSRSASWTGVRYADLLAAAGIQDPVASRTVSLDRGLYGRAAVPWSVGGDQLTLIALRLNDEELDIDHGYPARLIAPARPGVLQTKWLSRIEVS